MNRVRNITVLSAFAVLATLGKAKADIKKYPGLICVRWWGSTSVTYDNGAIGNASSSSDLYLDCPVTKDTGHVHTNGNAFEAKDMSPGIGVQCNLLSMYGNGSGGVSGWWSGSKSTSPGGGWQVRSTNHATSGNRATMGYYYFSCKIPPKDPSVSYISMFRVDERP